MTLTRELRPFQRRAVEDAISWLAQAQPGARRLYCAPTGCHARGQRVLRSDGRSVAAEDVREGDLLAGVDGPRRVLRLHRGRQDMVRVRPVKGDPFEVNLDHVLTLVWTQDEGTRRSGALVDVTIREWLTWTPYAKHCAKLLRAPAAWGEFGQGQLPIDPWLLGVLLGDGSLSGGTTTSITNSDPGIAASVALALPPAMSLSRVESSSRRGVYRLNLRGTKWHANPLLDALRQLELAGTDSFTKFVPEPYRRADYAVRLNLLAGLLDTDGHLSGSGYDFISASRELAEGVTFLARSLGLAAYLAPCRKRCQTGAEGYYFRVSISGECDKVPCRVARKVAAPRQQVKDVRRTGFGVELLPEADYFGWEVDGDHRYLLDDFTLTHNSGKSAAMRALQAAVRAGGLECAILTPSLEIVRGFLGPLAPADASDEALAAAGAAAGVTTHTRLQNAVLRGEATIPDVLLVDEVHHWIEGNSVPATLFAVAPESVWIGFTATPFRGTPQGTHDLRSQWGEPQILLTLPDAIREGFCSLPKMRVVPLVDDDQVKVANGEFVAKSASAAVSSRIGALAGLIRDLPKRPTVVAVPSTEVAGLLVEELDREGVDACAILQHTKPQDRLAAFDRCRRGTTVLVQIRVVSEGVDLPWLRQLVDARPVVSPVAWVQQLGRIMRPAGGGPDDAPEYICVCRNLERHAYLLGGVLPRSAIRQAQEAFPTPSSRAGSRGVGLESLRRFKAIPLPLADGLTAHMYSLFAPHGEGQAPGCTELVSIVDPAGSVVTAARTVTYAPEGEPRGYGPWTRLDEPPADLTGYATAQRHDPFSDKQREWWAKDAARVGLDPHAVGSLKRRQFGALPLLLKLHVRLA